MKALLVSTCLLVLMPVSAVAGSITFGHGSGSVTVSTGGTGQLVYAYDVRPSTGPSCVGTGFEDLFTEAGVGTINLGTHAPDDGDLWIGTDANDGSILLERGSDEIRSSNSGGLTKTAYSNLSANCSNYSVLGNAKTGSTTSSNRVGVLGRWLDTSGGNGYRARIEGDGTARLEVVTNGTALDLDTDPIAGFSASTYYDIELRMSGTAISMYVNGVLECTATSSAHVANGTNGALLRNTNARLTSTSLVYP